MLKNFIVPENSISIVIPIYKNELHISELISRIKASIESITKIYEIILVIDGSPDESLSLIKKIAEKENRIKVINFSRNFGQHYAITAGLEFAKFQSIIIMDGDLQDQPEAIIDLYAKKLEGFDIVLAKRVARKDKFIKRITSKIFYIVLGYLTNTKQNAEVGNFGVYDRKVVLAILSMRDYFRYLPTQTQWVGFNRTEIEVHHEYRLKDASSYSYKKLFNLAFDTIISYSDKPLRLTIKLGLTIFISSFIFAIYILHQYFKGYITELGYASLILSIWVLGGLIIFTLGVIGVYVSKMFETVKDRPKYIINDTMNFDEN